MTNDPWTADPWAIVETTCQGCGRPIRLPRNFEQASSWTPDVGDVRAYCILCRVGVLPDDLRAVMQDFLETVGLWPDSDS